MGSENRAIKGELVPQEPLTITIKGKLVPQEPNKLIIKGKPVERFTAA